MASAWWPLRPRQRLPFELLPRRNEHGRWQAESPELRSARMAQVARQHFNDCSSDFGPLGVFNSYLNDEMCCGVELSEAAGIDEQPYVMMSGFFGMTGSEAYLSEIDEQQNLSSSTDDMVRYMDHYYGYLQHDDVAELCGGASGTTRLLVRRGYRGGPNFDLICNCDLMTHEGQRQLLE